LSIFCKNEVELEEILIKSLKSISSKIKKKVITSQVEFDYLSTRIFSDLGVKNVNMKMEESVKVDDLDLKMVDELLICGRESLVNLAEKFNMTPNGINERIKKLEKKEIILGYKTKINYEKLGYIQSHIFINTNNMDSELYKKIKAFLKQDGRTSWVAKYMGYCNIEFRCNTESIKELYKLKRKIKNEFKEKIDSIEILIVVRSGISHLPN